MKILNKTLYLSILCTSLTASLFVLYSEENKIFPHKLHADMDLSCISCHSAIKTSSKAADDNLPDMKSCTAECHDKEIFSKFDLAKSRPAYKLENSHEIHLMQDVPCKTCHENINDENYKAGSGFPEMVVCYKCHDGESAEQTCSLCHLEKVQFPHKTHIDNSFSCEDCHKNIKKSKKTVSGPDIPSKKSCDECHDEKLKYADITVFSYKQVYKMNHEYHLEEMGLECDDCHKVFTKKNKIKNTEIVDNYKEQCLGCHDCETASGNCMLCHINIISPKTHDVNCDKKHKIMAGSRIKDCKECHRKKDFCDRCHKGIKKPFSSHNPNFRQTHKYESRVSMKNCKACHSDRYCRNCHKANKVTNKSKFSIKRHPQGWLNRNSPNFHKRKARLKLTSCSSCHTKNDCFYCHFTRRR